jgi:hypothetical protein
MGTDNKFQSFDYVYTYDQNVQLILKSYLPVVYCTTLMYFSGIET